MIQIQHLTKRFGERILFSDYSLDIPDQTFAVFTGKSGSGKTTLLNMIGGIEPADSGSILVDGFDVTGKKQLRKYYQSGVGFLFQNFALIENKTVEENLNMVRKPAQSGISIAEALSRVGMQGTERQKIYTLSGGEQQRIALARLICKKCSVVLADEPTGSLDRANAAQVMEILQSFLEMGKSVIMVTHDPTLIQPSMQQIVIG